MVSMCLLDLKTTSPKCLSRRGKLLFAALFATLPGILMAATPQERMAGLLSNGPLLTKRWSALPGRPGTPEIYHNGLGRYFVGRPMLDSEQRLSIQYAPDPEGVLELTATTIRRGRFGSPKYDQDQTFPVTRRLAYAAFPELRPKNQPPKETADERMERTMYNHLDGTSQAWNV